LKGVATMENRSFGQYIIQLRNKKSISQRKLAELAGVTNSTISRIEADTVKPDPATLEKLALALEVDKLLLLTKCGYSEIPEEFVIIARKTGELSEEKRMEAYRIFNETIDKFLLDDDDDDEEE
jgi:transcriptional regulator with XRE-family HTH domain